MNTRPATGIAAAMLILGSGVVFAADTPALLDQAKAALKPGEMVLVGTEMKMIHDGKEVRDYRVCVKEEKDAVRLILMFDRKRKVVRPGKCANVSGKRIEAAPGQVLTGTAHIVVTFHQEKK